MRQVTKKEFYDKVYDGKHNVHPSIIGKWPYTSHWIYLNNPHGPLFGKTVERLEGGLIVTDYFLNATHPSGGDRHG